MPIIIALGLEAFICWRFGWTVGAWSGGLMAVAYLGGWQAMRYQLTRSGYVLEMRPNPDTGRRQWYVGSPSASVFWIPTGDEPAAAPPAARERGRTGRG